MSDRGALARDIVEPIVIALRRVAPRIAGATWIKSLMWIKQRDDSAPSQRFLPSRVSTSP
jgi:hypothetical protein